METNKPYTLLVDGDLLAYKASSAVQKDIEWEDGLWTCHSFLDDAIVELERCYKGIVDAFEDTYHCNVYAQSWAFSDTINFRHGIDINYKSNRSNKRKPTCYNALVQYIRDTRCTYTYPKLEGDDVLGILHTKNPYNTTVIVSLDKDFKTVPGYFYNFGTNSLVKVTEEGAHYNHMMQTLMGDVTDGYKGCPTYGPTKANKLLANCEPEEMWEAVVKAYESKGLTADDALRNARLAYILHNENYNVDTGEISHWNPL